MCVNEIILCVQYLFVILRILFLDVFVGFFFVGGGVLWGGFFLTFVLFLFLFFCRFFFCFLGGGWVFCYFFLSLGGNWIISTYNSIISIYK